MMFYAREWMESIGICTNALERGQEIEPACMFYHIIVVTVRPVLDDHLCNHQNWSLKTGGL